MTEKKSTGCQKIALVLLSLWFVASLITIVVWATAPDFKSAAQCRAELKELRVMYEGSEVVCQKDREALEKLVTEARDEQDQLQAQILVLLVAINATNATQDECRQENLVLATNITALQKTVEALQEINTNLSTRLSLKEDHIEALEQNVTQAEHLTQACFSLRNAAQAQTLALEAQTNACRSQQEYLKKNLKKCEGKGSEPEAAQQTTPQKTAPTGSGPRLTVVPVLMVLMCVPVHLLA